MAPWPHFYVSTSNFICYVHDEHNMSFIAARKRQGKSGILTYYYLVEGYREDGKVKQRLLKYLGTSPFQTKFDVELKDAIELGKILADSNTSREDLRERLADFGIHPPPGEIKDVELIFSPRQKNPIVHIHYA